MKENLKKHNALQMHDHDPDWQSRSTGKINLTQDEIRVYMCVKFGDCKCNSL